MKLVARLSVSLAIAAVLIALLMFWGDSDPGTIWATLTSLDGGVYASALGVQSLIYVLRTQRFRWLLPKTRSGSIGRVLPVTLAHNFAAHVVPAKVGEASLVVYLRRMCGISATHGIAVLIVSRLLDLGAVAGSLSLACLTLGAGGAFPELPWLAPVGGMLMGLTVVFFWFAARGERFLALFVGLGKLLRIDRTRLAHRAGDTVRRLRAALREVSGERLWIGALASLPIWLCVFLFYAILARGFGLGDLTFARAVFGSSLAVLSNLLPIHGFAGFGTQEAGWVLGFCALGVARDLAFETGLACHLVYLFNISAFGLLGHLALGFLPAAERSEA